MTLPDREWISASEVSRILGVRRPHVRHIAALEHVRSKKLPMCHRVYFRDDVLALRARSISGGPPPEASLAQSM